MRKLLADIEDASPHSEAEEQPKTLALASVSLAALVEQRDEKELPDVGVSFLGFQLIGELGRGSFGRVYLARQVELAHRLVALKVSAELFNESQTLAQLQHTNIVPIYSAHRTGLFQAVCMPYFGPTTLADVFRSMAAHGSIPTSGKHFVSTLEGRRAHATTLDHSATSAVDGQMPGGDQHSGQLEPPIPAPHATLDRLSQSTYADAVLWLGARIADGLAHAHDRGVVHRDLKPANVLLADDGRPMILDFNLSADAACHGPLRGGTIPYMAPEQLESYLDRTAQHLDGRADIYALGLILFELLAGQPPFPRRQGDRFDMLKQMVADRQTPPPSLCELNQAVSPATNAIVQKCLAFRPEDRYSDAAALQNDLERQLAHEPLVHVPEPSRRERVAKWCRRHPRASSLGVLGPLAAGLVIALGVSLFYANERTTNQRKLNQAQTKASRLLVDSDGLRNQLIRMPEGESLSEAISAARSQLARYGLPEELNWQAHDDVAVLPHADAHRLRERLGELLMLLTQAHLDRMGSKATAEEISTLRQLNDAAASTFAVDGQPYSWWRQRERICESAHDQTEATTARNAWSALKPTTPLDRFLVGIEAYLAGRFQEAKAALERLAKDEPEHYGARLVLGSCQFQLHDYSNAAASYTICIGLNQRNPIAFFNRGHVELRTNQWSMAAADFEQAQFLGLNTPDLSFQRAKCLMRMQKLADAEDMLTAMIEKNQAPLRAHLVRSDVRRMRGNKSGAAADRATAAKLEPVTPADFNARGLARLSAEPKAALADFRRAEELDRRCLDALQNQANVYGEVLHNDAAAVEALNRFIAQADMARPLAARAVHLARLDRIDEALRDAKAALSKSNEAFIRYQVAGVYALSLDRPGHAAEAMRLLASAPRQRDSLAEYLNDDPELKPLRGRPEFDRLVEAARALRSFD